MLFDIVTIFPDFFRGPFDFGVVPRALRSGIASAHTHDLRTFTHDRHRTVDDRPFGGGEGMVLKPGPIFDCVESLGIAPLVTRDTTRESVILLSAGGRRFTQAEARRLSTLDRVVLICGRYEGVDERVAEHLCDAEFSIGDFVLSGGELAAAIIIDAIVRLLPGVLGNADSSHYESFGDPLQASNLISCHPERSKGSALRLKPQHSVVLSEGGVPGERSLLAGVQASQLHRDAQSKDLHERTPTPARPPLPASNQLPPPSTHHTAGLLDYPHYTRPADFRGLPIPEVLADGDHIKVRKWREDASLAKTRRNRPDLLP